MVSLLITKLPTVSLSLSCRKPIKYSGRLRRSRKYSLGHDIKVILMFGSQYLFNKGLENNGDPPTHPHASARPQSHISGAEILPPGSRSHPCSLRTMLQTSIVFLPTRQAALMTASSEARLKLALRRNGSRAGGTQPRDEYTSALPNPGTSTTVVSGRKWACPLCLFNILIDQAIRFGGTRGYLLMENRIL